MLRLLLSVILGGLLGYERQKTNHTAGTRTFALISLGSCLAAIISENFSIGDPGRISAQVVSGIGFLGAGIIIHSDDRVYGLTTAACVWLTAIIGLSCGSGNYVSAIETSIIALIILYILEKFK